MEKRIGPGSARCVCPWRRLKHTSLTGGNFFLHSSDKARRSLCIFSRSFFTASGLLVPDMVPPGPNRSGSERHSRLALSAPWAVGSERAAPQPPAAQPRAPRADARPGLGSPPRRAREPLLRRPAPPTAARRALPAAVPPREAPPAPAREPTRRAGPSRCRGARPRRASPSRSG